MTISLELQRLGFLVHELRNPLSTACLSWEALTAAGRFYEPFVDGLSQSLATLTERIDEVLSETRLDELEGQCELRQDEVSAAALILDALTDSRADAGRKAIRINAEPPPSAYTVRGDYRLLLSALTNLVRNAVKYTHHGGAVDLRCRCEEHRILIEVHDECGGLAPERADSLFQAFTQAHENRSGYGLGLAIAKRAIEAHAGTLMVRNAAPAGCVFIIDLPSAAAADEPPATPA